MKKNKKNMITALVLVVFMAFLFLMTFYNIGILYLTTFVYIVFSIQYLEYASELKLDDETVNKFGGI